MTDMTAADVLREARRLIAEKGWCREWYMKDADGHSIDAFSDPAKAASFCMLGAFNAVVGGYEEFSEDHPAWKALTSAIAGDWPPHWQDATGRTKDEVLAAFDRAIALASAGDLP